VDWSREKEGLRKPSFVIIQKEKTSCCFSPGAVTLCKTADENEGNRQIQNSTALMCAENNANRYNCFKDMDNRMQWPRLISQAKNRVVDFVARWRHCVTNLMDVQLTGVQNKAKLSYAKYHANWFRHSEAVDSQTQ